MAILDVVAAVISRDSPRILLVEFNPFQPAHTPISLGYLAAFLKKHQFETEVLNIGSDTLVSTRELAERLARMRPRVVGFSAYQRNLFFIRGLAEWCKILVPECLVALGGPQATFLPTQALPDLPSVDLVCRSEGEPALLCLAQTVRDGGEVLNLPGWSGKGPDGSLWDGGVPDPAPADLDAYPSPYLEGILDPKGADEAILLASRGCPYQCAFCYTPKAFGKRIRFHSPERVLEEMEWISKHGVTRFWFADPSFTFHEGRVRRLLEAVLSRGLRLGIWLETRADLVEADLLGLMKRAGVHTVAFGLESACRRVLERIRKPLDLAVMERAIRLTQEAGIEVELFSQYGLPGETFEDSKETLRFVQNNRVAVRGNTNAQQMQVYFGTDIQADLAAFGIRPLAESIPPYLSIGSRYETDWMSADQIQAVGRLWKAASLDGGKHIVS